ncbi:MAG: ferritin family protein [Sulfolobales archaeon]
MSLNDVIRGALDTEEKAADSYLHSIRVLRLQGMEVKDLENVLKKVSIETIIHKEVVTGLLKAYESALSKEAEVLKDVKEVVPSKLEKMIIVKLLKEHLDIESEMIKTYKKMAELFNYPVLKSIAEALAKNEEEHHRIIQELIKKYE